MHKLYNQYEKIKRDEIDKMIAKPKSYNGPALEFQDPEAAASIRSKEEVYKKML